MKDNVRPPLSCALSIEDYSVLFVFQCQIQVYDLLSCTHPFRVNPLVGQTTTYTCIHLDLVRKRKAAKVMVHRFSV